MPDAAPAAHPVPRRTGPAWARRALAWAAWALVVALLAQMFTAGMAVFVSPTWWAHHRTFVHAFEWLPLVAVVLALVGRAPRTVVALAGGTVLLVAVQYTTAHLRLAPGTQAMAALHPVSAVLLVWAAGELARRVTSWRRQGGTEQHSVPATPAWTPATHGR